MSKKGKISSILLANTTSNFAATYFRVGDIPLKSDGTPCIDAEGNAAFPVVESIKFCKHEFGAGALVQQACYAVKFENSPETIVIPAIQFSQITITVENITDTAVIPPLPQN